MVEEIATEGSDKRWWDYASLFNTKDAWWRNACWMGMGLFGQVCSIYLFPQFTMTQLTITPSGPATVLSRTSYQSFLTPSG
jgi:hypothetical protein